MVAIDDWLSRVSLERPVVLVIDDLHWADPGTLDALMYLIAGPGNRSLSILATLRNGEVGEGHPLQRWPADIRRMPRVSWMELGPLDYAATGDQLAQVLGAAPHQSLIREVYSHTAGNPYMNRLLVDGLRANTRHLPTQLPANLRAAVLRSWHTLSPEARELTELMAVGGRPIRAQDLDGLVQQSLTRLQTLNTLREAKAAGIAESDPGGTLWWFHHPLIPEILEQRLDEGQRRRWHAIFAAHEEKRLGEGAAGEFESLAALAHHHDGAGNSAEAYEWTMRAAAAANAAGQRSDKLLLLRRALELHGMLGRDPRKREALLNDLRTAAADAGALEEELETVETLIAEIDTAQRPLDVAELLVREAQLRFCTGREFLSITRMRRAEELARAERNSWQYALALAELSVAESWQMLPVGQEHATGALAIARHAGNPRALSYALTASSMAALIGGSMASARGFAVQAFEAAEKTRDFWAMFGALVWQTNSTDSAASQVTADSLRAGREILSSKGSPHVYIATMAGYEAANYLDIGRLKECGAALRIAIGSDPGPMGDAGARLIAARLALWQGRQSEAENHLARAEELAAHKSAFMNLEFDAIHAEFLLAAGDPEAAYAAAMRHGGDAQTMRQRLAPLAAHALADCIEQAKDAGRPTHAFTMLLEDLLEHFPRVLRDEDLETELCKLQMDALDLLYLAELGRARSTANNAEQWVQAADAYRVGNLPWQEAYSRWRAGEALLLRAHTHRGLAADQIHRGMELAEELQALPIKASLTQLATQARIPLVRPPAGAPESGAAKFPALTAREREILGYVIAGDTYAQIARSLVISEKTVSTHVSNILRKTGTANRLDLARLASRHSTDPAARPGGP